MYGMAATSLSEGVDRDVGDKTKGAEYFKMNKIQLKEASATFPSPWSRHKSGIIPNPKMRIVEKEPSFTEVWLCPFIMAPQEMVDH